jgi:hypothetical protein
MILKDLPLGVISDRLDVHEAAQIELLRAKLRHAGVIARRAKLWNRRNLLLMDDEVGIQ